MKQKLLNSIKLRATLLVAMLCAVCTGAWADEASFEPSDFSGQGTSGTGGAISATVSGVTFACDKGYGTTQIRCYSDSKITISSSNTITAISFTFSGSSYTGGLETSYSDLSTNSWEKTLSSQARITACTVTYSTGGDTPVDNREEVTLSYSTTSYNVNLGSSFDAPSLNVSPAAASSAVTYSSNATSVADVDDITGEVTIKAAGTATITASIKDDEDYKDAEASYTITVVDPTQQKVTLSNAQIVAAGAGANGYDSQTITDGNGKNWSAYAIKNQHSNATSAYHYLQIKAYGSGTAYYIQVPAYGTKITQLKMTVSGTNAPMTDGGNSATLFFSASNSTSSAGTGVASGTGASSVTIDCSGLDLNTGYITSSGAVRIWDVEVTYEYKVTVGTDLYTTHVTADAVSFEGVTAYIAKSVGTNTVTLETVASAPANTPVVIKADAANTYSLTTTSSPASVTGNQLKASDGSVKGDGSIYALGVGKSGDNKDKVGFYLVGSGVTIPAGKAYLTVTGGGEGVKEFLSFDFDGETAINEIVNGKSFNGQWFNLAGQRVNKAQKGIFIVNGKKVVK